jgi:hypothetical protein
MKNDTPRKGCIAICGIGCLGLITSEAPQKVGYLDGNTGIAWIGIHITDKVSPIGSMWTSRNPRIICHVEDLQKKD